MSLVDYVLMQAALVGVGLGAVLADCVLTFVFGD